jgi:RecA-family ATPase
MIADTNDLEIVMHKLENLEDEELAVVKLKEFNDATKKLHKLLMNLDKNLSHGEWKAACDDAKTKVSDIVEEIKAL